MSVNRLIIATVIFHMVHLVLDILVVNVNKYEFNYSKYNIIKV